MDTDFLTKALSRLKTLHIAMRDAVREHIKKHDIIHLSRVSRLTHSDFIYDIDDCCENILYDSCKQWGQEETFIVFAEGLGETGTMVFPESANPEDASFCLVVDPIDGTRGIMYDKRSAWILSGIAPYKGLNTSLTDIELAIQTEIPTGKQYISDMLYAVLGRGTKGERTNLFTNEITDFYPRPSSSTTLKHGFAMLTKFFPGRKQITAKIEEELMARLGLLDDIDSTFVFDDQYISTGGQFYELAIGHDRFSGDFRAHLMKATDLEGHPPGLAAHPYDVCTSLVATEAGVIITDLEGNKLNTPLDVISDVSWIAYANKTLQIQIESVLQDILRKYNLL